MSIRKEMTILELLSNYPKAVDVLEKHGLKCSDCMAMTKESLEEGARRHGIALNYILDDLKNVIE